MSDAGPSLLPNPPQAPPLDNYTARLRHRLNAEVALRRAVERENLRLRTELGRLQRLSKKRGTV
jgi:hypothetical protein